MLLWSNQLRHTPQFSITREKGTRPAAAAEAIAYSEERQPPHDVYQVQ